MKIRKNGTLIGWKLVTLVSENITQSENSNIKIHREQNGKGALKK